MREHSTAPTRPSSDTPPSSSLDSLSGEAFVPPDQPRPPQGGPEARSADALKLDTRTLEGKIYDDPPKPAILPYDGEEYRDRPINYPVYEKSVHFRAKIQEFTGGGFEVTICGINMNRYSDRALQKRHGGPRLERRGTAEDLEKSRRRAKRTVRLKCKELGADHLVTLTTRETLTIAELTAAFARFTDLLKYHLGVKLEYVCVPEQHPSNPTHYHLHLAIRGRIGARQMVIFRRCWYIALGGKGNAKGADVPGGFNVQHIRVRGGPMRRMDKIAGYLSKYITKSSCVAFNKKSYWCSKINLPAARAYWLKASCINDALVEFLETFDFFPSNCGQDFFNARNIDLIWMRCVPENDEVPKCPF